MLIILVSPHCSVDQCIIPCPPIIHSSMLFYCALIPGIVPAPAFVPPVKVFLPLPVSLSPNRCAVNAFWFASLYTAECIETCENCGNNIVCWCSSSGSENSKSSFESWFPLNGIFPRLSQLSSFLFSQRSTSLCSQHPPTPHPQANHIPPHPLPHHYLSLTNSPLSLLLSLIYICPPCLEPLSQVRLPKRKIPHFHKKILICSRLLKGWNQGWCSRHIFCSVQKRNRFT